MRRADVMLIPVKCLIHLNYIKTVTNREVSNSTVDNDNVKLTQGGRKDLQRSGLTGFVFF